MDCRFAWLRSRLPIEVLILDQKKLVVANLVSSSLIGPVHSLASNGIHELMPQPMACPPIHLPEGNALGSRDGGVKGNGAGSKRELEVALPVRAGRHTQYTADLSPHTGLK